METKETLSKTAKYDLTRTKSEKGITLVALVITIIILLILAGISIQALSESGLFGQAQKAKQTTKLKAAEEEVQLAIMASYGQDGKINLGELKDNLSKIEGISNLPENITKDSFPINVTIDGQEVKIEKKGETLTAEAKTGTYKAYKAGDKVAVGGENFYVIKASGTSEEKVTLLAEKNIDTTTMKQSDSAGTESFCTDPDSTYEGYWTSIEGITYPCDLNSVESERATAINYAKAYGTAKGGTGRLMKVEEARGITGTESGTINSPAWIKTTSYWLSSASSDTLVWNVYDGGLGDRLFGSGSDYGVRPVIEISKSKIS